MGLASFAAGLFPLKAEIALGHMNLASALSLGILLGTALAAVIPEGVEMLIDSGYALDPDRALSLSAVIGISLVSGFAVMFLVDHFEELTRNEHSEQHAPDSLVLSIVHSPLTLGLLLHSFVDGIALGTAFLDDDNSFQILFMVVIIAHKLPTAFSLSVVLHQEGLSPDMITKHLAVFSATTPVSSLLTYLVVLVLKLNSKVAVGVLFLFSAGTFMYSVTHVMFEVTNKPSYSLVGDQETHTHGPSLSRTELLLSMAGMMIPVLFTLRGE